MFGAISEGEWSELLPRYRMTFLQIWNWDYGSPQRRKRLWVIGSRSKKAFVFKPPRSRIPGPEDTWSAIQDLPWQPWVDQPGIDHVHHLVGSKPIGGYWSRTSGGERWAIQDFIDYAAGFMSLPPGLLWPYMNNHGRYVHKPSRARPAMGKPARVLSGNETINHPLTGWPLTIRERARIMGWPDGFRLSDPPEHSLDRTTITKMVLVTGRAVPSEFPRFLIPQLMDHASSI
jgi:site-specific DNA-cytosine methylase